MNLVFWIKLVGFMQNFTFPVCCNLCYDSWISMHNVLLRSVRGTCLQWMLWTQSFLTSQDPVQLRWWFNHRQQQQRYGFLINLDRLLTFSFAWVPIVSFILFNSNYWQSIGCVSFINYFSLIRMSLVKWLIDWSSTNQI